MADNKKGQRPHIVLQNKAKAEVFSVPQRKVDPKPMVGRDRARHGSTLITQVQNLEVTLAQAAQVQRDAGMDEGFGLQVELIEMTIPDKPRSCLQKYRLTPLGKQALAVK